MANNVIGLFENESVAESVVEELVASGFKSSVIKRFRGNNDQLEDELRREGIPADEASYYVNGLNEGGALVSVRAEENETDSAVDIMNRYVNTGQSGAEDTGIADTDYGDAAAAGEATYQGSDAGWDDESSKGVDADGADYDGVGSSTAAGGVPVGRAAYEAYNQQRLERQQGVASSVETESVQAESHASTSPFPIGREAYATYTRRQPGAESETFTESTFTESNAAETASGMGFPIGREAYAAYTKRSAASAPTEDALSESPDSWTETGTQASGYAIGREAYEAYSREKAEKWRS